MTVRVGEVRAVVAGVIVRALARLAERGRTVTTARSMEGPDDVCIARREREMDVLGRDTIDDGEARAVAMNPDPRVQPRPPNSRRSESRLRRSRPRRPGRGRGARDGRASCRRRGARRCNVQTSRDEAIVLCRCEGEVVPFDQLRVLVGGLRSPQQPKRAIIELPARREIRDTDGDVIDHRGDRRHTAGLLRHLHRS